MNECETPVGVNHAISMGENRECIEVYRLHMIQWLAFCCSRAVLTLTTHPPATVAKKNQTNRNQDLFDVPFSIYKV